MSLTVLGVIPARGGSRGLPRKNLRPLAGLPLIGHTIRCAGLVTQITRSIVSTDDPEIAAVARELGGDVPFLRPPELARDDSPTALVVRHALEFAELDAGIKYDAVVLLEPTSPCRVPADVEKAIDQLATDPGVDGVVSISEPTFNPLWVGVRTSNAGPLERFFPSAAGTTRRQELEHYFRINGSFYVWRSSFVRRLRGSWFDEGTFGGYEIPESQAFSIDDEYEFKLIEALVNAGMCQLPGGTPPA